jgi:transcriptional regulator with XRE-family HTH domain
MLRIHRALKRARINKGLSQAEIARALDVAPQLIWNFEHQGLFKLSPRNVMKYCREVGLIESLARTSITKELSDHWFKRAK